MGLAGEGSNRIWRVMYVGILLVFSFALSACISSVPAAALEPTSTPLPPETGPIIVTILNPNVKTAVVRVVDAPYVDDLDQNILSLPSCFGDQFISVWASGYYIKTFQCNGSPSYDYQVTLDPIDTSHNAAYSWMSAQICGGCHTQPAENDEFTEWGKSNHAKVFVNRYFETMYLGTYLGGVGTSPQTVRDVINDDLVQRAPVMDLNYHGPGYKLDFPDSNGNCSFCHAPVVVAREQLEVSPFAFLGTAQEGITCDICHKVVNVELSDEGFPYESRPGVLSFEYLLPPDAAQFYIGPLTNVPDIFPMRTTCSTVFSKSEFCAACHYGKFYDMVVYGSYKEWKESDYGKDPQAESYQSCQDCHMSPSHAEVKEGRSSERQACSAENLSYDNFDHNMMNFDAGTKTPLMVKGAGKIDAGFVYDPNEKNWFSVLATVRSRNVGHRFPTDSPLRHLILVVEAKDARGMVLAHVNGERIPNWAGVGDVPLNPGIQNYGGLPGKIYANLLVEEDTNVSPTAAYWNKTKFAWTGVIDQEHPYDYSDTRLLPERTDRSRYSFAVPEAGDVTVTIKLIYRFAFIDLMWRKGWWDRADILVTSEVCTGPPTEPLNMKCETVEP